MSTGTVSTVYNSAKSEITAIGAPLCLDDPPVHDRAHVRRAVARDLVRVVPEIEPVDVAVIHLAQRDVSLVVVSRAPLAEIEAYKKRMGWKFKWVSSFGNDFNRDFHVSFTKDEMAKGAEYNYTVDKIPSEELPGLSAFIRDENGKVFHTYSSYARGLDTLVGTYNFLDMAPKGRDEGGLPWSMAWVRRHDEYEDKPKSGSYCA